MFADALELKLTVTAGSAVSIPGANVKRFKVALHPYGFTGEVDFWISSEENPDTLYPKFVTTDVITAKLEILPHFTLPDKPKVEALTLAGMVTDKRILIERKIINTNLTGNPVLYRLYSICFADPASVLWKQHFPCELMVDNTVKDLIDAHKCDLPLTYDWDVLTTVFPINALPLGMVKNQASFYDFIIWYVFSNNGVFTFDTTSNNYSFSASKSETGNAVHVNDQHVENLRMDFPATIRNNVYVLNAYSENPVKKPITNEQAVGGVYRDYIERYPVAVDVDARTTLETSRLKIRDHEAHVTFRQYPLITFRTGVFVQFKGYQWSPDIFAYNNTYRVRDIYIEAETVNPEVTAEHNMPYTRYNIEMQAQLELKAEKWVPLPDFTPPWYPLTVEGKIISQQGAENEETYQIYQDAYKSLDCYRVKIPLFGKEVIVPFEPNFFTGHFYFPAYKNERVLVDFEIHSGLIMRFLDWRPGARLPMDTQGNHLLLGKVAADNKTTINHVYVNGMPVLNIQRVYKSDTQIIKIEEGIMTLETKEEDAQSGSGSQNTSQSKS